MATPFSDDITDLADRIAARYVFEARIQIRLQRGGKQRSLPGWARDLSESGLGAFVAESLILGELLTLEVPIGGSNKQMIPATVSRALGTEYGFQFTALSPEQRKHIRAALKGHPAIPYHANRRRL
jgi:PilZ domain